MRVQGASPLLRMSGLNVIRASREVSLPANRKKHCVTVPAETGGGMGRGGGVTQLAQRRGVRRLSINRQSMF